MASPDRPAGQPLIERLEASPFSFDFFQAVRRLECAHSDQPRIGNSVRADEDPTRFGQQPSLAFAPSTIASFEAGVNDDPARMLVHFLGLLGPNGPMPIHFTEHVHQRGLNDHDPTIARFLDVFHHRMISLFYRAWASSRQAVGRDRPGEDRFAVYVASLLGLGLPSLGERDSVPIEAKLHYAGHLSRQSRNAEGLQSILGDYFGVPTRIVECIGHWVDLPEAYRCRLGASPDTGVMGKTVVVGSRFWDRQQKFRVVFGPLDLAGFERFLPITRTFRRLADWIRNYIGDQLTWDVQLVLEAEEVPATRLGGAGRLGWTTWLKSRPFERDSDDLVLRPPAA